MAARKKQGGNQGGRVGCLFILLAFCVGLLVLLANIGKIKDTLDRTNFTEIMKNQAGDDAKKQAPVSPAPKVKDEPEPVGKAVDPKAGASSGNPQAKSGGSDSGSDGAATKPASSQSSQPASVAQDASSSPQGAGQSGQGQPKTAPKSSQPAASGSAGAQSGGAPAVAQKTRKAQLFFVRIDDDGVIARQEVSRQIPASDQPLTDSLAALLSGPSEAELRRSLLSLIPQGTKLLSVQVRGSTAILNFNEAFMYNHYGIEGYAGQLKQVVYTATAFASVQDVQILIEGERHDYLGGEGVYIGKPLSRNSF